ncbi:hypothetical protein Bca4012_023690 [Brassica carinata]
MGGKRKRHFVAPKSATTSNVPPVVLPNNNPAPSVRDYPPPRQLFPASTYPYSGSAPVPQTRAPQSSGGEATSNHQPRRRQSPSPPIEESPLSPLHGAPSPHSSQAQNSHEDPEDFAEFEDPVEPDLSEDVMDKTHTWDPFLTGLVHEHFESICLLRLKGMDTGAAVAKSAKASAARLSDRNGLGIHKHNSGQKSYMQIEQELTVELGRPKKGEKLANLEQDNTEISDGSQPMLTIEEDNELFIQSTFCNDRGDIYGIGSLKKKLKRKQGDPRSSFSFMHMQQKLEEAERKIEEQATLIAKAEEDRARVEADNQAKMAEFNIMHKYMRLTDPKYLAFIASEASSPAPDQ